MQKPTRLTATFFAALLSLAAVPLFAADPAPAPANPAVQTLSPEIQSAIADLGSDDFKTREAALKNLQIALGNQMRALVSSDDPEIQTRLIALLQFNDGLTRWIIDTYKLPADQRKSTIDFGLQPDVLPVLALVFSSDPEKRVEGAQALAKNEKPESAELLARLLNDPDRAVYIAAMEAVWDKKPTDAIVDILWDRAIDAGFAVYRGQMNNGGVQENIKFRGRPVGGVAYYDNAVARRTQDGNIATDVLINLKAPQVHAKVKAFLEEYEKATSGNARNNNIWLYSGNSEPMKNALRLMAAYRSKETLAILYKIATGPVSQRSQGQMNAEKYSWSNRTTALATLVTALDLKPEDYNLKREAFMSGIWTTPTEADEDAAVKKIQAYWAANADGIDKDGQIKNPKNPDAKSPDKKSAVTAATKPADPAQPNAPQPGVIIQGNGNIQFKGNIQIQIAPAPNDANN